MANNTVNELAAEMGIPAKTLLSQFKAAGIEKTGETDSVSETDKRLLLETMRQERGSQNAGKVTVQRRETTTIRQRDGQGGSHTIEVEMRRKRVFVKREDERAKLIAAARAEAEAKAREELAKKAAEEAAQKAKAEKEAAEAEKRAQEADGRCEKPP